MPPPRPGIDCIWAWLKPDTKAVNICFFCPASSCTILNVMCVEHLVRSFKACFTIQFLIAITTPRYNQYKAEVTQRYVGNEATGTVTPRFLERVCHVHACKTCMYMHV